MRKIIRIYLMLKVLRGTEALRREEKSQKEAARLGGFRIILIKEEKYKENKTKRKDFEFPG